MKKHTIEITYHCGLTARVDIVTDDIAASMQQYQRNREALTWEIIKIENVEAQAHADSTPNPIEL